MEKAYLRFQKDIESRLKKAYSQKREILLAADWVADCIGQEGWIYAFGTGHSHMLAEELFYRAGGFARVIPILDPDLMLHISATKSTELERNEGYSKKLLQNYPISKKDLFFIFSNSGRNPAILEMALLAKEKGAKVIAITNLTHSKAEDSRHSSGQKLFQVADLFLDNFGQKGDAAISIKELNQQVGPSSSIIGAALIQSIIVQAAANLAEKGIIPEIFSSANAEGGELHNLRLIEKYRKWVKIL